MVRSMMNLTTLSLSFWDYALECATRILNRVPTKKEIKGYYLYFPLENKIVVARYVEFLEKNLISQEASGRAMQSDDKNYQVWRLVEIPPNGKTIGSKWLFKKKTDMDDNVHTYKARLVAKGSIMYAVRCTRPDVAFAQNITSCFQQNPGEPHSTAVKNILMYLRNTKDMFFVYGGNPEAEHRVTCYYDVGFETNRDDIKSQTGHVFILNREVEYIVDSEAAMEAVWIRKFISGFGSVPIINEPIKMLCNNSVVLLIANEPGVQKGARHYHRRYHYVRECIQLGEINLLKVHT
ncbi:retrotransposon protein, putative, ty1-copia subclass [Tanacetum coccineum]